PAERLGGLIFWKNVVPVDRCQLASRTSIDSAETLEPVPRPNLKGPLVSPRVESFLTTAAKVAVANTRARVDRPDFCFVILMPSIGVCASPAALSAKIIPIPA